LVRVFIRTEQVVRHGNMKPGRPSVLRDRKKPSRLHYVQWSDVYRNDFGIQEIQNSFT